MRKWHEFCRIKEQTFLFALPFQLSHKITWCTLYWNRFWGRRHIAVIYWLWRQTEHTDFTHNHCQSNMCFISITLHRIKLKHKFLWQIKFIRIQEISIWNFLILGRMFLINFRWDNRRTAFGFREIFYTHCVYEKQNLSEFLKPFFGIIFLRVYCLLRRILAPKE